MPQQLNCSPLNNKNKNKMAQNVPGAKVTMEALFVERQIIKHIQIRVEFQRILQQLCDRVHAETLAYAIFALLGVDIRVWANIITPQCHDFSPRSSS